MVTGRDMNLSVMVAGAGTFLIYASWADFSSLHLFTRKQDSFISVSYHSITKELKHGNLCCYLKCKQAIKSYRWDQSRHHLEGSGRVLTGNGSQVQVVPDHLLEFMVQGALLKLQAEVVTQISVQHLTCREEENSGSVSQPASQHDFTNPLINESTDHLKQGFNFKQATISTF